MKYTKKSENKIILEMGRSIQAEDPLGKIQREREREREREESVWGGEESETIKRDRRK